MTQTQFTTEAQTGAAKPWAIAFFSIWIAMFISYACAIIYMWISSSAWVGAWWMAATWLIKRSVEEVCFRQLDQIEGKIPRTWTCVAFNILKVPMIAAIVAMVTFLACWLY